MDLITENDIDLAHALENTLNFGDLVDAEAYATYDTPVVIETPDGYRAIGSVSYGEDFIVLTVLE